MAEATKLLHELEFLKNNAPAGFALAFHVRLTTPSYLFQTYSQDWISYYSENGLVMSDPTVLWGFENDGIEKWSSLEKIDSAGMLAKAAEFGLGFGITWACGTGDSRSLGSFARNDREFTTEEAETLAASAMKIHELTVAMEPISDAELESIRNSEIIATQTLS